MPIIKNFINLDDFYLNLNIFLLNLFVYQMSTLIQEEDKEKSISKILYLLGKFV